MIWILVLLMASSVFGQDPTSAVYHDNVVMVVDGSGSMRDAWTGIGEEKMALAKRAMKTVLSKIDANTQIGIVVFNGGNSTWVYELGPKNDAALIAAIDSIQTGGGTPLGTNIKLGADTLIAQRQKQFGYGSYRLLIVTDGAASGFGEESKMNEYTPEVIARGINVDVIGVDMGKEHSLAKIVGSNYRTADNPESLEKAITEVFAEVSKTGDGGAADFELLQGLDPNLAKEMIGALAKPQNHPIGEKPPAPPKPENRQSSAAPAQDYDWNANPPVTPKGIGLFTILGGGAGIVVLVLVIRSMTGGGRGY